MVLLHSFSKSIPSISAKLRSGSRSTNRDGGMRYRLIRATKVDFPVPPLPVETIFLAILIHLLQQKPPSWLSLGEVCSPVRSCGDPYTVYLTPTEAEEFQADIDGTFDGLLPFLL